METIMNQETILAVYNKLIAVAPRTLHGDDRHDWASEALQHAIGRYNRQQAKLWTVDMLCWGARQDMRTASLRDRSATADTDTVAAVAVARVESIVGVDDILSTLTGRDAIIARAWSDGLTDDDAAVVAGCCDRTVRRLRVALQATLR